MKKNYDQKEKVCSNNFRDDFKRVCAKTDIYFLKILVLFSPDPGPTSKGKTGFRSFTLKSHPIHQTLDLWKIL